MNNRYPVYEKKKKKKKKGTGRKTIENKTQDKNDCLSQYSYKFIFSRQYRIKEAKKRMEDLEIRILLITLCDFLDVKAKER